MNAQNFTFKFIDLFAGIGGLRIALERAGGKCIFSSEYDQFAQKTYEAFFGEKPVFRSGNEENITGDIKAIDPANIPDHDFLAAGFPCQPFSLAGVSKKQSLGRPHGFNDPTQGTLFHDLKEIIRVKKPAMFLLENVKNIKSHDGGRTIEIILNTLDEIGYEVAHDVIDAAFWTPQHRERVFFAGFRRPEPGEKQDWYVKESDFDLKSIIPERPLFDLSAVIDPSYDSKYILGRGTWNTLKRHKKYHASKGQGFGYGLISEPYVGKKTRTLSARYHKDGAEILIDRGGRKHPRRLTPLECCRLMGFPHIFQRYFDPSDKEFQQPVSDTQAYRQFGNSVSVPVVTDIVTAMVKEVLESKRGLQKAVA